MDIMAKLGSDIASLWSNYAGSYLNGIANTLLLALADYGAQRLFMPWQLPVGVLTVSLGGIYLIVLLIQESRKK